MLHYLKDYEIDTKDKRKESVTTVRLFKQKACRSTFYTNRLPCSVVINIINNP